jgi:uncharacterized cupredoxin-like copper-binding protein/Cu/Ag efflux protein CusF
MKLNSIIVALSTAILTSTAIAGGNHAGDHGEADAIGQPGKAAKVNRIVIVNMSDTMRFEPASIAVKRGETIKFIVKNSGKIKHEMFLGTEKELTEHYEAMKKNPQMEHVDENLVAVEPGKSGEIIWRFTKPGKIDFACLQPGHYDAGMKGAVNVSGTAMHTEGHTTVYAQDKMADIKMTQVTHSADMTDGEIRKIDKDNNKITIKHGEIRNLDMPGMTMVFRVKDPAMLDNLKTGDKVRFTAEKSNGSLVVTGIQPSR